MLSQVGSCPHCGASLYSESPWWGIAPPAVRYSCSCHLAPASCQHCYCQEEPASSGGPGHRRCCKCGDRVAFPSTYRLVYRVTSAGAGDFWDGELPWDYDVPLRY